MAAGQSLAEIYVMRKIHKEKMKATEEEERPNLDIGIECQENKPSGCFFWVFKKIHPSSSRIMGSAGKEVKLGIVKVDSCSICSRQQI
ncbi:hypothetical protein CJ030_MR7G010623 [Morella rubra]|uniref:Uncharacterized protein n=1 Tax=Morella rubra TaxID=262757 RepID=A0A6A1UZB5_9ROSI|nr:hypothetical protein CJ030_MR7G010623 [Morella rubra]